MSCYTTDWPCIVSRASPRRISICSGRTVHPRDRRQQLPKVPRCVLENPFLGLSDLMMGTREFKSLPEMRASLRCPRSCGPPHWDGPGSRRPDPTGIMTMSIILTEATVDKWNWILWREKEAGREWSEADCQLRSLAPRREIWVRGALSPRRRLPMDHFRCRACAVSKWRLTRNLCQGQCWHW